MKYEIRGTDNETGEEIEMIIEARDEADADALVQQLNIRFYTVSEYRGKKNASDKRVGSTQQRFVPAAPKETKECHQCKEWIDKRAMKCPHCRSTQPPPAKVVAVVIGLFMLTVLSCCVWSWLAGPSKSKSNADHASSPWTVKNWQDAGINVGDRSVEMQRTRRTFIDIIFTNVTIQTNVVRAEIKREAVKDWHAGDDLAHLNLAGMLYAYYFSEGTGEVVIFDGQTQVGRYRWQNGPEYQDH